MPLALVVDDDDSTRTLFREVLQRNGFTVLTAGNADDAFVALAKHTPDIAFIDVNMPARPGTHVLAYIKSVPRLDKTKTVMVTANTGAQGLIEELGADLYLLKPVSIVEMLTLAHRLTRNRNNIEPDK